MKKNIRDQNALWLNWEYLSAEDWAVAMHGKPSPQTDGTAKYFWLMGFDERSGGLLREKNYAELIDFDTDAFRKRLGLPFKNAPEWLRVRLPKPDMGRLAENVAGRRRTDNPAVGGRTDYRQPETGLRHSFGLFDERRRQHANRPCPAGSDTVCPSG